MPAAFTTHLGLALPIIQGPMTGSDTPALAAAVSEAGGLGMLGCGMRSPAAMAEAAAAVRQQTDRPFGMNLFVQATPTPEDDVGVYLHIPFCERVCPYCDFAVVGGALARSLEARYVAALTAGEAPRPTAST